MARGQTIQLHPSYSAETHPLGSAYDALASCLTSEEAGQLVPLPRREISGIPVRDLSEFAVSVPAPAPRSIELGRVQDRTGRALRTVTLSAEALNRHVFLTGMTGYGKSVTAKSLLVNSWQSLDIPFLVIEPVKAEYRQLAEHPAFRDRLRVYAIGDAAVSPLRLNPFVPIESIPLGRHVDLLKAVFNAAFPMFAGMSYVLEEAMLESYEERGWDLHSSANDFLGDNPSDEDTSVLVPSISDVYVKIDEVLERRKYGTEIQQNIGAALRARLKSLMVGSKGMALDTRRTVPTRDLFAQPTVIELRNLGDDEEKSFVMALLLCQLYEYAESRQAGANAVGQERLQHLTLIEEAHRLLGAPRGPGGAESADSQAKAVTMFTDMLAEMRSYGEGFVIVDQIPTKLAPDIIRNSSIKIVHRLAADADRAAVGATMNLTAEQSRHLATMAPGEAVVHDERIGAAALVRMPRPEPAAHGLGSLPLVTDRTYLRRNGGCRRCPRPCDFLPATSRSTVSAADRPLEPVFQALLLDDPEAAWSTWTQWRAGYRAAVRKSVAGHVYCAASQAGYRWLGTVLKARAGIDSLPPDLLLDQDRAARVLARFVDVWSNERDFNDSCRDAFADARQRVVSLIAVDPPIERPGCSACPARCLMLPFAGPYAVRIGQEVAARATAASTPGARVRSLRKLLADQEPIAGGPKHANRFLYCLVANAAADADVDDVLDALRED